ncbi:DUF4395 domain-containing protein [Pedobacter sp. Hv1]|uniref:DUF4395 domain-containing protein n=1 Tax=Pedobacter sp. Hv1 TaxID=1740090 RepID=UPI0006D8AE80|nr:DUF4395 domain-containing protein [Pedobacter sp. Hv1]KQC02286.1 hypothetical protein AQF98_01540 [Pedobacter sp. Hv1]
MDLTCPISAERINESVVRIIAILTAIITVICILMGNYWAMVFLTIDFAIRAFTSGKWSILRMIASQIFKLFSLPQKMKDLAPKKFAATMGFVFCLLISGVYLLNFPNLAMGLAIVLIIFALLEGVFAICVGCYIYSFYHLLFLKKGEE